MPVFKLCVLFLLMIGFLFFLIQGYWREEFRVAVGVDVGAFEWMGTIFVYLFEW